MRREAYTVFMLSLLHIPTSRAIEVVGHGVFYTALFLLVGLGWLFAFPIAAHAQESLICSDPIVGNFIPHVYDGELHSFEYTIEDTEKHLPFVVRIDGRDVSLHYITIWDEKNPGYRTVHVDVPFSDIHGDVSIYIGMVQITDGSVPPCITTAVFDVLLPEKPVSPVLGAYEPIGGTSGSAQGDTITSRDSDEISGESEEVDGGVVGVSDTSCESASLSTWIKLLGFAIIIALLALAYMPTIAGSNALLAAVILLPLVGLLGMWYVLDSCREFVWFPFGVLLTSLGVLAASSMPFFLSGGFSLHGKKSKSKNKTMTLDEMLDKLKDTFDENKKKKGGSNRGAIMTMPQKAITPTDQAGKKDDDGDDIKEVIYAAAHHRPDLRPNSAQNSNSNVSQHRPTTPHQRPGGQIHQDNSKLSYNDRSPDMKQKTMSQPPHLPKSHIPSPRVVSKGDQVKKWEKKWKDTK